MTTIYTKRQFSPHAYARLGGLIYIMIIILGISTAFFFRGKLMMSGNVAATATNIQTSALLWRMGIIVEYASIICTIVLSMIYYILLQPVHKNLNLLSTFLRLVSIIVQVIAILNLLDAFLYLDQSKGPQCFTPEQWNAMAYFAIKSYDNGFTISLFFLGCCFLVHGYLIYHSEFLPKLLGIFIQVAGFCYIINGFVLIIAPTASKYALLLFFPPVFIAETSLGVWLFIKGVNNEKWKAHASAIE